MSQSGARRAYQSGSQGGGSTINQKAALASAYQELGKELASSKLKMVGNYTLQRPIGEGTYGKVRLGLHRLTNTRVAIKQIPKAHSASLTREIHHHRRLHHPNVMQLYEVIATEQYIWMVSELCAGGELYDYLVENEVLAEPEARRIFGQLCLAVAYVHSKGIVHRDLKLENILLDERCNVKLGDFGFTREFERKRLMETFCGTTGYASPEMLAGNKYTGEEVDIWSLGVILYALLCGALPFDDDDESIMKDKILRGDFEIPDCLSEEAQSLIALILQHEPSKRPSIETILAHPWFTKTMAQSSMSTVEEDENALDYFDSRPLASTSQLNESAPEREPVDAAAADAIATTNKDAIGHANARSDHLAATHQHHASASGVSEGSYYSARSGSESSDRRSSNTDLTDPTTADTLSRTDEVSGLDDLTNTNCDPFNKNPLAAASIGASASSSQPNKETIGLHRNESQTTIRRLGSNGSDASLGAVSRPSIKSTSMSLPTHHELPTSSDGKSGDLYMPMYQSVPLVKRGSQSSSRGHHRTPSRTKRRSLSSSGLSDHHPPLLGRKPVDYVSQLAHLQPATFCTAVEQDLLHQLSTLGIDVGQMVHSVMTDACDTSGAMWWMLLRKAKDCQAQQPLGTVPATESVQAIMEQPALAATTMSSRTDQGSEVSHLDGVPPPPVPVKDPARRSEDRSRLKERSRASLTASKSENTGLSESGYRRLQTVVSHEVLDVSSGHSLQAWASGAVIGTAPAVLPVSSASISELPVSASVFSTPPPRNDRSLTSTPESTSSPRPKSQHRHTTVASSPSKLHQMASSWVGGSPTSESSKGRRNSHADRPRSNSLSVKQLAQSVLGTKDKAQATPPSTQPLDQVIVAGEALPMERAKSPTLFGRRNTVSNVKDSMVGRRSNPSTPKKATAEVVDKPRKSMGKNSIETDLDRVKTLDRSVNSASSSPSRSGLSLQPASASTLTAVTPASEKKDAAVPSASQDSFSTLSNVPRGSEKSGARGKASSSFMATVRTWLGGANEKPTRKSKAGKKGASHRGLGIDDGTSAGRSPTSTLGTSGSVPTLVNGTPSRSPSMRRKSAHYQQASVVRRGGPRSPHLGSMSRRSSNGSSHHGHLDLPPNSFSQSMSRPGNMRRMSAGSITPTATLYGDYVNDIGGAAASSRHSRPSSSHSLARSNAAPRSGLHGKADSTGSTSSVYRPGQASSAYSTGSGRRHPRPSHDGGTTVRRHRAYASSSGSPSRRNSFRHDSRPSSIKSRASSPSRAMVGLSEFGVDTEVDGDLNGSGARKSTRSTPRHSLELRNLSDSRKTSDTLEPIHPQHHQVVAQSIFVAHKSRSPYRPPSANSHLHGSLTRGQPQANVRAVNTDNSVAAVPSTSTGLPATGTGTWRHSWGRPPPCWAGPVDPPPAESEGGGTAGLGDSNKPKLRDVFAHRDDDDWTDEDEEPSYSGGLGQMGSLSSMTNNAERNCTAASSSPYATRNFAALGSGQGTGNLSTDSAVSAFRGAAPFSARYAGVRNIFQNQQSGPGSGFRSSHHPVSLSLGNEFMPKLLSATLHSPTTSQPPGVSLGSVAESAASTTAGNATTTGSGKTDSPTQQSQQQTGSRITGTFHKPVQIIEEEEEEEEEEDE